MTSTCSLGSSYPVSLEEAVIALSGTSVVLSLPMPQGALLDHFPQRVIVPAFVQIDWIAWMLVRYHGASGLTGIVDAKFLSPICPPCLVRCDVHVVPDTHMAEYAITSDVVCSKGTVRYSAS